MKANVLGTEYEIVKNVKEEENKYIADVDGYCDFTEKKIYITDMEDYEWKDKQYHENKVIRHELVHAFLYESGLDINTTWARNEEIVDWIAIQSTKMNETFKQIEVL